jgi:uncharacterized protein (DUF427 family)
VTADHPRALSQPGDTAPVPRRVRARLDGEYVVDTTAATYVWEHPYYPQFYLPPDALQPGLLDDPRLADRAHHHEAAPGLVHLEWDALDAWFEEDEEVFVHPRSPYVRVDALRSSRHVRVELDGLVLAESNAPVLVFETGLPTRYYLDRTCVDWSHLEPSDTQTPCPYKGRTSAYWSVRVGDELLEDRAWSYDFPTRQLQPIAGLVCFYNESVDLVVDGIALDRPRTKFS